MTASRIGLAVLAAIALLLGGALALEVARGGAAVATHALLADLDVDRITALTWSRPGAADTAIVREGTRWHAVPAGDVEPGALDRVLVALRGGRWHRLGEVSQAGKLHATLAVTAGGDARTLGLGEALPGGEQGWVVVGERALLVDAWVLHALDPEPLALRVTAPFADAAGRVTFRRGDVVIEVDLARGALVQPQPLALAPERVAVISQALAGLTITRLPARAVPADAGLQITAGERTVELAGECPGDARLDAIRASTGDGCVPREATNAVGRVVSMLAGDAEAIVDPRPVAVAATRITLLDGAVLDLARRPTLAAPAAAAPMEVEPARVAELLAALAAPAVVVPLPEVAPRGALEVAPAAGPGVTLDVWASGVVARRGEPVALRPEASAFARLVAPSLALRDATLWVDEPTAITTLTLDGRTFARGAVIGEWSAAGGAPAPAPALEALAEALASPRVAQGDEPPAAAAGPVHHIAYEVTSPVGEPVRRALDLEPIGKRCALRANGRAAWVAPTACVMP